MELHSNEQTSQDLSSYLGFLTLSLESGSARFTICFSKGILRFPANLKSANKSTASFTQLTSPVASSLDKGPSSLALLKSSLSCSKMKGISNLLKLNASEGSGKLNAQFASYSSKDVNRTNIEILHDRVRSLENNLGLISVLLLVRKNQ